MSPFPGYFPESTLPYQHYPACSQGWQSRMSESEQYFNNTITKLLKTKSVIDKISLMTEIENSLKGTSSSSIVHMKRKESAHSFL